MRNSVLMIMYGKSVGGAELQFIELANYLAENHGVRLLCLGGEGAILGENLSKDIEIKVYSYSGKLSLISALSFVWLRNCAYQADVIVTTSFIGNLMGFLLGFHRGVRTVSLQTVSKCMRRPFVDKFVLRRFYALIAGAEDIKAYLLGHLGERNRIEVIHNWVDFSRRGHLPEADMVKEKLNLQGKLVIGCIGRLHPQKGQIYLIDAFAQIAGEFPGSILLLVGGGAERDVLEERVNDLNLCERVLFVGEVAGNGYNEVFAAIDIYVQPSIFEGLPRTLLDAMFYGKPVIASDINGNSEAVVSGVNGMLVPSANVPALVEAIKTLVRDVKYREELGLAATQFVREHFEMRKQLARIENILFESTTPA